ncbi:MAG: AraC family transcriptional regulator [Eubacteriales bacterium]|nr:AraC family transcriptional regulator [Eubacteriales bacterium]
MIENLNGIHETVNYRNDMEICLYNNDEAEDYPPHWHIPFELIMPTENSYRAKCGNNEYFIREADILIICPGVIHELFAPDHGERMIFQSTLSSIASNELDVLSSIISPAILITPEKYPQIHGEIHQLMLKIKKEFADGLPYSGTVVYSLFLLILAEVGRNHAEIIQQNFDAKNSKQKEYMEKFLFVTNYISDHFTEDLTLEQVASLAGFSKYHFTRLFRQYAGTSFYKYLNQKRIAHAKNLLLDPDLSVTEVALQSGFTSISAFLRMFRLANNCTPTEFRKMYD